MRLGNSFSVLAAQEAGSSLCHACSFSVAHNKHPCLVAQKTRVLAHTLSVPESQSSLAGVCSRVSKASVKVPV